MGKRPNYFKKQIVRSRLREWIVKLELKDWRELQKLQDADALYELVEEKKQSILGKVSKPCLAQIIKHHKRFMALIESSHRRDVFDLKTYNRITKSSFTNSQWNTIKYDISRACSFYQKLMLMRKNPMFANMELHSYLLERNMRKNLNAQKRDSETDILSNIINDSYRGFYITRHRELLLSDIEQLDIRKRLDDMSGYHLGIELFYHENKLKVLCEKLNRRNFNATYEISKEELNWLDRIPKELNEYPQIQLYSLTYRLLRDKTDELVHDLENMLKNEDILSKCSIAYLSSFHEYLIVYSTQQINEGNSKYIEKYIEHLAYLIEHKLLLKQGYIPIWRFKNIVKASAMNHQYEFAEKFINDTKEHIVEEEREILVAYCQAYIYFRKGKFQEAFDELEGKEKSLDPQIKYDISFLLLMSILNIEEYHELDQRILNFKGSLQAKTSETDTSISQIHIDVNERYRKSYTISMEWLDKVANANNKPTLRTVGEDIENTDFFPGKDMLLDFIRNHS